MHTVGINPEYFARSLKDYSNWQFAWFREIAQNSVDCGSTKIDVTIATQGDDTLVVASNDGPPMSREVLVDKFLNLGGTTKTDGNTTGGFGIAKLVLCFAHKSYEITTGVLKVKGEGGTYSLSETEEFKGTRTKVLMRGDVAEAIRKQIRTFASFAQLDAIITLDGEVLETNRIKGTRRKSFDFGTVFTNKSDSNQLVVRKDGMPMFIRYCGHNRLVILELEGESSRTLTANRDGLVDPFAGQLSDFITELSTDIHRALKDKEDRYEHFSGPLLSFRRKGAETEESPSQENEGSGRLAHVFGLGEEAGDSPVGSERVLLSGPAIGVTGSVKISVATTGEVQTVSEQSRAVSSEFNFIIKNETGLTIPEYYKPGPDFSEYSRKLLKIWGKLMVQLHRHFEAESTFSLGFVFSGDVEAMYEEGKFGKVFYLNPVNVTYQSSSSSRSFKKRFKLTDRNRLLMIALHEFVHSLGFSWHSDGYASMLTDLSWQVMNNRSAFNWCFK